MTEFTKHEIPAELYGLFDADGNITASWEDELGSAENFSRYENRLVAFTGVRDYGETAYGDCSLIDGYAFDATLGWCPVTFRASTDSAIVKQIRKGLEASGQFAATIGSHVSANKQKYYTLLAISNAS